jgi:hypothetical protein
MDFPVADFGRRRPPEGKIEEARGGLKGNARKPAVRPGLTI